MEKASLDIKRILAVATDRVADRLVAQRKNTKQVIQWV
jgi:hypothetical protein